MKPLYKALCKFVPALALTAVLGSCDAEKDLIVVEPSTSNVPYDEMYMVGYGLTPYIDGDPFVSNTAYQMEHTDDPNVFTATIEMYHYTDNKQFKFVTAQDDWNKVKYIVPESGVVDGTSYAYVEIGADKVNQGAVCSESAGNLRDHFWGIREGEDGVYKVTLNALDRTVVVELIEAKEQPFAPEELYIVGDGTPAGWNISKPTEMEMTSPQVFEYTGNLFVGEMKCPMQVSDKWEAPFLMPAVHGTKINRQGVAAPEVEYVPTGNPDSKWYIEEEGQYHLVIDCTGGKNAITISAQYLGPCVYGPELHIQGLAGDCDFSSNTCPEMDYDEATGIFSWETELYYDNKNASPQNHNKQFKFTSKNGDWNTVDYYIPAAATADGYIEIIGEGTYPMKKCTWADGQTGIDAFWGIAPGSDAVYEISVDLEAMTVTLRRTGDAEPQPEPAYELYMLGVAGNSGTDSNNPGVQLTLIEGTHTFYWEGELYYTTEEGNRQFNFIRAKGDWDKVPFLVPEGADSDQYRVMVKNGGVYKMKQIQGPGNPLSASWGIEAPDNGKYRVEVDIDAMEVKTTKL